MLSLTNQCLQESAGKSTTTHLKWITRNEKHDFLMIMLIFFFFLCLLGIFCLVCIEMNVALLFYFSDHAGVSKAYEAMKNVASLINERKRRLESIDTIAHWQVAILHWEVRMDCY